MLERLSSHVVEVTRSLSKVLKYNDILIRHDDKYIINKKSVLENHKRVSDEQDQERGQILNLNIIHAQADDILANSRALAEKILLDAQIEAESIKKEAYEQGYLDGKEQGYKDGYDVAADEAKQRLDKELKKVEELRIELYEEKATILKQSEEELLMLALAIAEKVVDTELQDEKVYRNFIKKTLNSTKGKENIKLHVSEADFNRISSNKDYIVSSIEGLKDIEIISDRYLTRGSCIVDGGAGVIDGSVNTQLNQIKRALESILNYEESTL